MGTHGLIVLALIVLPMLAPGILPMPDVTTVFTNPLPTPAPPPRPAVRRDTAPQPAVNPNAAPTEAPREITPERLVDPGFEANKPVDGGTIFGTIEDGLKDPIPAAAASVAPVRVGGQIRSPTKIHESPLVYPAIAQAARVQGMVIIEALIDADGRVTNAKVLRSIPLLDQAALDAVRTWQYTPTLLNGVPVAVIMTVVVQFRLN
jgi:protein TonB